MYQPFSINFLKSPWDEEFDFLIKQAKKGLVISSPYIGMNPCKRIIDIQKECNFLNNFSILLLTDLSRDTILSGATDVSAICKLTEIFQQIEIRFLPSIHAKIYVADEKLAVVTSANMTNSGLLRNFEYGVKLSDRNLIAIIKKDIVEYAALGTQIDQDKLKFLNKVSIELTDVRANAEKSIKSNLRAEFERRLKHFDDDIIRLRAAGRTPHAIFADAILYFLAKRPLSTEELHPLIQKVHPDLCDDSIDRIIDGKHFGKKWKHAVRTAQQHLKKKGLIHFKNRKWWLILEKKRYELIFLKELRVDGLSLCS